jgi:nucleotide-binding universal stress UspA family protein
MAETHVVIIGRGLAGLARVVHDWRSSTGALEVTMSENTGSERAYEIVVGFDFSELAERALEEALTIASARSRAELHVVVVAENFESLLLLPGESKALEDDAAQEAVRLRIGEIIDGYCTKHGPVPLERVAVYVLSSVPVAEPGRLIARLAESVDADLIVVGTHGRRGVARLLLGSVAQQVVREAGTNVYVVRPADMIGGHKVPSIEPPLPPGSPHLKPFEHRRTYHYVDKVSHWTNRTMPVS